MTMTMTMTMTLRQWPPRWRPKRGLPQWGRQKGSMWFAPTPTSPWTPWNSPWFELELVDLKFVHTCCPQWTPGTLIRFEPRSSTSRGVQPILYCETLQCSFVVRSFVPLNDVSDHTNHIFSVRIWSWQRVSVNISWIHYWVEPSLLLSSFLLHLKKYTISFEVNWFDVKTI